MNQTSARIRAMIFACLAAVPAHAASPAPVDPSQKDSAAEGSVSADRFGGKPVDTAYGAFQRGLYRTALNLALVRARNGDPYAQTLVAEILSRGLGVRRDDKEAARWYELASEQGIPDAQFQYALILMDGRYVTRDENAAFALMEAAAESGSTLAQFNLAQMLSARGSAGLARALSYYERAAKRGLPDAQYAMSQILANGVGSVAPDLVQARRWLERAAVQNFDTAQIDLGSWLVSGRGGKKDEKAGFAWLLRAAQGGNIAARNRLAKLYVAGIGTDPDMIAGAAWYISARRAGLRDPEMDDTLDGLTTEQMSKAIDQANRLR